MAEGSLDPDDYEIPPMPGWWPTTFLLQKEWADANITEAGSAIYGEETMRFRKRGDVLQVKSQGVTVSYELTVGTLYEYEVYIATRMD